MKVGITYPQNELGGDPDAVRRIGLATEKLGFDHLLVYDHVLGATHDDRDPPLEGYYTERDSFHDPLVMLGYLAGITQRIELVPGVLILPQRQTVLVARQAADVDLLSGERLRLCVGIGWNHVEYDAMGQNFRTRGERMAQQVGLLRQLWTEPLVDFKGEFDRVDRAALNPRPLRSIPIWMGGFADAALRRAARMADGFLFADTLGDVFEHMARIRQFLRDEGREEHGFGLHCNMLNPKNVGEVVDQAQRWRDAGGTHVSVHTMGLGFATIDDHIGYMEQAAKALRSAGC